MTSILPLFSFLPYFFYLFIHSFIRLRLLFHSFPFVHSSNHTFILFTLQRHFICPPFSFHGIFLLSRPFAIISRLFSSLFFFFFFCFCFICFVKSTYNESLVLVSLSFITGLQRLSHQLVEWWALLWIFFSRITRSSRSAPPSPIPSPRP